MITFFFFFTWLLFSKCHVVFPNRCLGRAVTSKSRIAGSCETISDKWVRVAGVPLWEKSMIPLGKLEQAAHQKVTATCLRMDFHPVDWLLHDFALISAKNAR